MSLDNRLAGNQKHNDAIPPGGNYLIEPLLDPANDRLTIYPIKHKDLWMMYKKHQGTQWFPEEVKLANDLPDWKYKLKKEERSFIKQILAFFASSDKIVGDNLMDRFLQEVQYPEATFFYGFQNQMENIHSETYSNMIDTYIEDPAEKTKLFDAIKTIPWVKKKADWAKQWTNSNRSFAHRLVAFAIVEGIFFSGAFCAIYWLNEKGVMKGLAKGNDFIARDEGLHTAFACLLYNKHIINKISQKDFKDIMDDAVHIEIEFITESIPCRLLGMNAKQMIQYIKFCANRLAKQLLHQPLYNNKEAIQPFSFMDRICLREKDNFFEGDVSAYASFAKKTDNHNAYEDLEF